GFAVIDWPHGQAHQHAQALRRDVGGQDRLVAQEGGRRGGAGRGGGAGRDREGDARRRGVRVGDADLDRGAGGRDDGGGTTDSVAREEGREGAGRRGEAGEGGAGKIYV